MTKPLLSDTIDEQAARWTSRLDGGELSAADRLALHAWLDEHPAHRAAFEYYQMICDDTAEAIPSLAQVSAVARPDPVAPRRWRGWMAAAAGIAAVLTFSVGWLVPYFRDTQTVTTVAAQRSTLSLQDGTRAELNAQTELFTDFRGGRRLVRLAKGEAFFSVARVFAQSSASQTPREATFISALALLRSMPGSISPGRVSRRTSRGPRGRKATALTSAPTSSAGAVRRRPRSPSVRVPPYSYAARAALLRGAARTRRAAPPRAAGAGVNRPAAVRASVPSVRPPTPSAAAAVAAV